MRRAYFCDGPRAGHHVILDAARRTTGRCIGCWPDADWPADAPQTRFRELTADEWASAVARGQIEEYRAVRP